jgi:hypothetical protein
MRERPRFMLLCVVCRARGTLASPVQEMAPQINAFREAHQHGAPGLNIRIEPEVLLNIPMPRSVADQRVLSAG